MYHVFFIASVKKVFRLRSALDLKLWQSPTSANRRKCWRVKPIATIIYMDQLAIRIVDFCSRSLDNFLFLFCRGPMSSWSRSWRMGRKISLPTFCIILLSQSPHLSRRFLALNWPRRYGHKNYFFCTIFPNRLSHAFWRMLVVIIFRGKIFPTILFGKCVNTNQFDKFVVNGSLIRNWLFWNFFSIIGRVRNFEFPE